MNEICYSYLLTRRSSARLVRDRCSAWLLKSFDIEVGRRVAPTPPHGSRRAVFPHRALQNHSLPHLQSVLGNAFHLRRPFLSYPWSWNLIPDQRLLEGNPVITSTLAPPVEPFIENPNGYVIEFFQSLGIPNDPIGNSNTPDISTSES